MKGVRSITGVIFSLAAILLAACSPDAAPRTPTAAGTSNSPTSGDKPLPAGVSAAAWATQVVAASHTVAYVLAGSGPSGTRHPALFRTRDGGAHFDEVAAPSARSRTGHPLPILKLTFVDAGHGYAILGNVMTSRPAVLVYTTDAARSWHRARLPGTRGAHVASVAGHGRQVFAAVIHCQAVLECAHVSLYSAAVGARRWHDTGVRLPVRESGDGLGLAAWRNSVWLLLGLGSSPHPLALHSHDSGRTFARSNPIAAISCDPVATSPRVVWASCSTGMMEAFLHATTGEPARLLPVSGAGTADTFLDPLSDSRAYFGTAAGHHPGLYLTRDGGRSFTKVADLPRRLIRSAGFRPTFLDGHVGISPLNGLTLLRTTDGGHTWTTMRVTPR